MSRALRAGSYLAVALIVISLILVAVGLLMAARPELFVSLNLSNTNRFGLALALVAGLLAIASAVAGWILDLIRSSMSDKDGSVPQ